HHFQTGMPVENTGKNHLSDDGFDGSLSRMLKKAGPVISAVKLLKPLSRSAALQSAGVNDHEHVGVFSRRPDWFVDGIVIDAIFEARRKLDAFKSHLGILV